MTSLLIKDVRVFTGEEVLETGNVLIEDGIITYVGTECPNKEAPSISAPGNTLMPGM